MPAKKNIVHIRVFDDGSKEVATQISGQIFHDGKYWVSRITSLGLATQGDTRREAVAHTQEAIEAWFDSCIRRGVLDAALTKLGWEIATPSTDIHLDGLIGLKKKKPQIEVDRPKIRRSTKNWESSVRIAA